MIFFDNETNRDLLLENDYIPIEIKEQLSTDLNEGLVNLFESYTPETVFESLSVRPTITFEFDVQIVDFRDPPDYYPRWSPHQNWRFMADASDFSGYDAVLFLEYINGQIIGTGIRPWPTVSSINLYLYDTNTRMFVLDPMWTSPGLFYNELFRRNVPIMPAEYIPGPEAYETIGPTTYDRTPLFNPRTGEAIDLRSADIGSRFLGWHDSDGDGIIDCEDRDITPSAENTDGDFLPDFMDPDLSVNHRSIFLNPR